MSFPQNLPKPAPKLPPRPGAPASGPAAAPQPATAAAPAQSSGGGLGGLFKKLTAAPAPAPSRPQAPALPGRPAAPAQSSALPGRPGAPVPAARPSMPAGASAGPISASRPGPSAQAAATTSARIDLRILPAHMVPMVEAIIMYDELLVEENDALAACNPKAVEALQTRKQEATKIYNDRLRTLLSDPNGMRGQPPEIRDQVMALIRQLEQRCAENAMLLKANMEATEKVFGVINSAVIEARRREAMYTNKGGVNWGNNTSVAFNATA